ncbi:MAG: putative transporter [Candidatus Cryptobacteroides sp.]|nr:putative transporter [Bacteroidales bacterium]
MVSGTAYSILLFAVVITIGLWLGKLSFKGISLGATWILFVGIVLSHFGFRPDAPVQHFMKDFGLILFVFSIGLQVGPGFFHSFKKGGLLMNGLAVGMVLLAAACAFIIHIVTGESLETMVGVMSGAVTNTPGLGAAQQTLTDAMAGMPASMVSNASSKLASAYAVAYPLGVLGVILVLILLKAVFRIDTAAEIRKIEAQDDSSEDSARRIHCEVENPALFGMKLSDVLADMSNVMVVSRIMRDGHVSIPSADTVLQEGDKVLVVSSQKNVERIVITFGKEIPMHVDDWVKKDESMVSRKIVITKGNITGKRLRDLNFRALYGVSVTRVIRAGIELVARADLILQMGDRLQVVGTEEAINSVASVVGNKPAKLNHPNLMLIFAGIALGVFLGSLPIRIPGVPQPIKLGLAGGPLIVAILLGYFGPRLKISTYTSVSANMMLREIGISFFLAAVGLGAGENFVSSLMNGGWSWILYGALITFIPVLVTGLVGRLVFKLDFYQICGLITGATTNPPVLAFAQNAYGTDYTSVNYATVYPLSMFMRVLVAQVLILIAVA